MKHLKNEQGAALVLTIMIITLILLFMLALSTQVLNTTKQVDTMEDNISSRSLAEMGVTYYQKLVETENAEPSYEDFDKLKVPEGDEKKFDNYSFEIHDVQKKDEEENELQIEFTSIGKAHGHTSKINETITVKME